MSENIEDDSKWMKIDDIALELGIPLKTIYGYYKNGKGPKAYKFGRHVRVKREDFESWTASSVLTIKSKEDKNE
jgi:excisionase family DNA binding protein